MARVAPGLMIPEDSRNLQPGEEWIRVVRNRGSRPASVALDGIQTSSRNSSSRFMYA